MKPVFVSTYTFYNFSVSTVSRENSIPTDPHVMKMKFTGVNVILAATIITMVTATPIDKPGALRVREVKVHSASSSAPSYTIDVPLLANTAACCTWEGVVAPHAHL